MFSPFPQDSFLVQGPLSDSYIPVPTVDQATHCLKIYDVTVVGLTPLLPLFLSPRLLPASEKSHNHTRPPPPLSFLLSQACLVITTKSPFQSPTLFPFQLLPLCFPLPHLLPLSWKIPEARAGGTS